MSLWDDEVREYQREIDKIRDNAPRFLERLNTVIPEAVYMNLIHCNPPLTMLSSIISGNANAVLSPAVLNNATSDTASAKEVERRKLRAEVVEVVNRLANVLKLESLLDLISGAGRIFTARDAVYYSDVYDEATMEEEQNYLRDQNVPPDRLNYDSDEWLWSDCDVSD